MEPQKTRESRISARKLIIWVAGSLAAGAAVCNAGILPLLPATLNGNDSAAADASLWLLFLGWGLGAAFVLVVAGYAAVSAARRLRRRLARPPAAPAQRLPRPQTGQPAR